MTVAGGAQRAGRCGRGTTAWRAAVVLLLAGCSRLGPPPMEPLTAGTLAEAERRWEARGADAYHVVVRVRAPRFAVAVYDVVVADGRPVRIEHDGRILRPGEVRHHDYSVSGLFALLRDDLHLAGVRPIGDVPPVDLRARFEPDTGRLVRYRRTVGSARRRVLMVEVLEYQPLATAPLVGGPGARTTASLPEVPADGPVS